MGERLLCKQEVIGSIPFTSTMGVEWPGTGPWPFPALELSGAGGNRTGTIAPRNGFARGRRQVTPRVAAGLRSPAAGALCHCE